ncbi:hypothetical protein B0T16DRAFT_420061 [Cercophora newfieldiana]|uniref:Uncharacterized protein n=1 Tax=Cercophora newfieldiana TaxID=92897 RepID=A0AA39XXF1_9PEZI|nr:hypothetical protein B0T16DRAFT_420061 [Cercophora newfieldiana]
MVDIDITSEGTLRRHPLKEDGQGDFLDDSDDDYDNLSTQCLPRASANLDRGRLSTDNDSAMDRGGYYESRSSFPRSAVSGLRHRFSNMNLKAQPVKVKKWFVRQFRASRKGSRVIVKKVRERRARRKVDGGNASGGGGGRKKISMKGNKRKGAGSMRILRGGSLLTMFGGAASSNQAA